MKEKELVKKSGIYSIIILFAISIFWFLFSIQASFGYSGTGTTQDLKSGSRINGDLLAQPFNGSVTIFFGTQSTSILGTGTAGYIGTNTTGLPKLKYSYTGGASTIDFIGFGAVKIEGLNIPSSGSVTGKIDAVGGTGTANILTDTTLAGQGTITGTYRTNGVDISPTEIGYLDGASSNIPTQIDTKLTKVDGVNTYIGSVTAGGKTGTSSVAHNAGSNMIITSTTTASGGLLITYDASGTFTSSFGDLTGLPTDNGTLTPYIPFLRSGTKISLGTSTDSVSIGTTTQWNNSNVTIFGSSTSPLTVITHRGYVGTNTTAIMTGTSTPNPSIISVSSTFNGNYSGYEAFDGVISGGAGNGWAASGNTNEYIIYNFGTGTKKAIGSYQITANITDNGGAVMAPNTFELRASNDNTSYTSIDSRAGEGTWTALETRSYTVATSTTLYQFYKVHVTSINGGANTVIGEIQLIEKLFDNYPSMFVSGSGTVGIGTTTPSAPLHIIGNVIIDGSIFISETTALNVPDYAFRNGYSLMPLAALEYYIETEGHLPNFQSAEDTKSINLVQDNMALRRTAEETILYLIAMKKEIEELKLLLNK